MFVYHTTFIFVGHVLTLPVHKLVTCISLWARVVAKILAMVRTKIWAHRFFHSTESNVRIYVANTKGAKWREISPWDFLIGLNRGVRPCFPIVRCQVIVMHNI